MENIETYLKKYGKFTFKEEKLNEIDAIILSLLSYIDLSCIVPSIGKDKILLKDASKLFFQKYTKKDIKQNILSVRNAIHLLEILAFYPRYENLYLYNYYYEVSQDMQFGAISIMLPTKEIFISYEGTDSYISGWKEDCMFTYIFPTKAQEKAIWYLNQVVSFIGPKVYIGGHSKGANLALVSSMFSKTFIHYRIKRVYLFDGPGLRKKEFESKEYKKILPKLAYYVPKYSVVGMLLRHSDNYIVVESKNKGLLQHDATSWIINDKQFKRTKISDFSKKVDRGIINWLDKLDDVKREQFVNSFFSILNKANINDLNEFRKARLASIIKVVKEAKNMDRETKAMMMSCFKNLYKEIK